MNKLISNQRIFSFTKNNIKYNFSTIIKQRRTLEDRERSAPITVVNFFILLPFFPLLLFNFLLNRPKKQQIELKK